MQTFIIPGKLDGLNQIIKANRTSKYLGAKVKKENEDTIIKAIKACKIQPESSPVFLKFRWVEPNKKRDMDNIASAKKMVLDALVRSGILENDGWQNIAGFSDTFEIDKDNPRVEVVILSRENAVYEQL